MMKRLATKHCAGRAPQSAVRAAGTSRRSILLYALGTVVLLGAVAASRVKAAGWDDPEQRRRYVEDAIRALIESESERTESVAQEAAPLSKGRRRPSQQLSEARPLLTRFSQEATGLAKDLDYDLDNGRGIRPIFGDVLKLRARSFVLAQNSMNTNDHEPIAADYSVLSSDWQTLSFRLRQVRGLDRASLEHVEKLDEIDEQLGGILEVRKPVDREELLLEIASLRADLKNLLVDVEAAVQRSSESRRLILEGQKVQQQADRVGSLVSGTAGYDAIVAEYQQFETRWTAYTIALRALDSRQIERNVRRINHSDSQIHLLLKLPTRVDSDELLYLTTSLMKDVDEFYVRAPLKLLITLPEASDVIPTCNQFYGVCEHFADAASSDSDQSQLIEDFRYVEDAWGEFQALFRQLNSSKAQEVLNDIDRGIMSLREALQLHEGLDREKAASLASSLTTLQEHLDTDLRRWLDHQPRDFRKTALAESQAMGDAVRRFQTHVLNGGDPSQLQRECEDIFVRWQRVHGYVKQCNTSDRLHLLTISAKITPVVVELRTRLVI